MRAARPLLLGLLLLGVALLLVLAGAGLRGSLNPACAGRPWSADCLDARRAAGLALYVLALPTAIVGGVLVAIWQGRRAADEDA